MSKSKTIDAAIEAVRALPHEAQDAIAHEILEQIEDYRTPDRPPEIQALIEERMSKPRTAVSRDDFMAMLRKYNPAL